MTSRAWMLLVALAGCDSWDDDYDPGPPPPTPIAHDDSVTVREDSTAEFLRISVLDNDEGLASATHPTFADPLHGTWGTATVNLTSQFVYGPDPGYHGPDQFTYTLENSIGETSTATVTIDVTSDGIRYEDSVRIDDSEPSGLAVDVSPIEFSSVYVN